MGEEGCLLKAQKQKRRKDIGIRGEGGMRGKGRKVGREEGGRRRGKERGEGKG